MVRGWAAAVILRNKGMKVLIEHLGKVEAECWKAEGAKKVNLLPFPCPFCSNSTTRNEVPGFLNKNFL